MLRPSSIDNDIAVYEHYASRSGRGLSWRCSLSQSKGSTSCGKMLNCAIFSSALAMRWPLSLLDAGVNNFSCKIVTWTGMGCSSGRVCGLPSLHSSWLPRRVALYVVGMAPHYPVQDIKASLPQEETSVPAYNSPSFGNFRPNAKAQKKGAPPCAPPSSAECRVSPTPRPRQSLTR